MIHDQRVMYNTLDVSAKVNDFRSSAQAMAYTTGSYLYIGAILPFNNLWFEMGVANTNAATVTVEIWYANAWVSAIDVIDQTVGLTATGRLMWNTDRLKGWDIEQSTEDVTGLTSFNIYNRYWVRLSWSANFSGTSSVKYIGQKFSTDDILYSFYPDLNNTTTLTSFESGKTTWDEQHYMAAEHIVRDLKKQNIIKSRGQIMDWSMFEAASCHKIAEIVYTAFGRPYFEQLAEAKKAYKDAMNLQFFDVDLNANGSLDPVERRDSTHFVRR